MKTLKSEKTALTKEIKKLKEYIEDMKSARGRSGDNTHWWYLGDKVSIYTVMRLENELKELIILREQMNKLNNK